MDALVAEVAVTEIPLPVPIVMEVAAIERPLRAGTAPQIVVDRARNCGLSAVNLTDRSARFVAKTARDANLTQSAAVHPFKGLTNASAAPRLRAGLAHLVGAAGNLG